jgi:subtilase family serine protease
MKVKKTISFAIMAMAIAIPLSLWAADSSADKIVQPDLVVTSNDLSVNKTAIKSGDKVTLKAVVKNGGTLKATNVKVRLFFNKEQIYEKTVPTISINGKTAVSYNYQLSANLSGGQLFSVIIDPDNAIAEISEDNNQADKKIEVSLAQPDLVVTPDDLSINKKSVMGGDKVTLKAMIKNSGTVKATNVKVRLFFNNQQVFEKTLTTLSVNGKTAVTYNYQLPADLSGAKSFKVTVDPDKAITELNEENNTAEKSISIGVTSRDLFFDSIKALPSKPKIGQQVTFQLKIKNSGNGKAGNVKVNFYGDNKSSEPTATLSIPNISANASVTKTVKWTVPANISTAVGYAVRAEIDPENSINETNESNNAEIYNLDLTAPDLKLEADNNTYTHGILYKNVDLVQWAKITNNNVMPVNNVKVALFYYLGNNSSNLVKLTEQTLGTLAKKQVFPIDIRGKLPDSIALGTTIHVIVKLDPDNQVVETNETNNQLEATRVMTERPRQVQYPYLRIYVNDENGDPKNGATVKLTNTSTGASETKTTGSEAFYYSTGNVIFESRPASVNYTVEVTSAGYRTVTESFAYSSSNDATQERQINLDKKAQVSGKITGPNGAALADVKVRIMGTDLEATTDNQGNYGFLLNGGVYTFHFSKAGYARIVETDKNIAPLSAVTLDKSMSAATVGYVSGIVMDDEGQPLSNADIWVNGNLIRVTGTEGKFDFQPTAGSKKITIKKPGYVSVEFTQDIVAGEEYDFSLNMYKPSTDSHAERGTTFVSWHQHEGTPANSFFIPEYNVDVWWGIGNIKMGLDYTKNDSGTKATKLTVQVKGQNWDCHRVEGDAAIETSAIDIPITIGVGDCTSKLTQIDVYKVAIISDNTEVWSDSSFWTSASDPMNVKVKVFTLDNLAVSWNSDFKVQVWARVQKRAVIGTDGDGAGALTGYHLDKKLITWFPQKPATTKVSTSWSQIGGYFLGILDNPVTAITSFTDLFTVQQFNQYTMTEVLPQDFPGAPPNN